MSEHDLIIAINNLSTSHLAKLRQELKGLLEEYNRSSIVNVKVNINKCLNNLPATHCFTPDRTTEPLEIAAKNLWLLDEQSRLGN